MKNIVFYVYVAIFLLHGSSGSGQVFSWAQGYPAVGGQATRILSTTFDSANNVYSLGWFSGTIDVDRGPNVYNITSVGNYNIFLLKQDSTGNFLWAKHFPCKSPVNIGGGFGSSDISLGADGSIYLAGTFSDTADFDPGPGTYFMGPAIGTTVNFNGFVLKLDSSGNFVWAKQVGGLAGSSAGFTNMKVDKDGNIFLQGAISNNSTIDVDPGPNVVNLSGGGILIEKLDSAGNYVWAKKIDLSQGGAQSMIIDSQANIYFTGMFMGTVDFDPGPGTYNLTHNGGIGDIFVIKLDSAGNFQWAKQIGNADADVGQGISVDPFGNVFVVGYYQGPVDFDPGPGVHTITTWSRDMFVLRLRNNGDFSWVKSVHPAGNDDARAVATDGQGNVYTAGEFFSPADFDPGPGVHMLNGGVYVQKLDSAGNFVWAVDWQADLPHWIGLDYSNSVYSTGHFSGANRDFDPGTGTFLLSGSNNGSGYIHKLTQSVIDNVQNVTNDSEQITVYPNPSSGVVRFSSSSKMEKIAIADMTGKTVLTAHPQQTHIDINMAGRSAGVYFYTVETNGHQQRGKLVVR